ncbi:hypothetical protein [Natrialba aegyptia]|uniref:Uncharacterized protein n=1 Tax=Natrialba aegyptia DSM 13077 TaxID=1227491 RepID=M0B5F1_9EURY|nr:hypothetical protein [Natrialba aegyptia]ELZ05762.1 hypothetical protein C480_10205 [Natrialba aegyptia DSM 13077]
MSETDAEPCLHCGTETIQRADGEPYCSMDCIRSERRKQEQETIDCPYPDCDWYTTYRSNNGLSQAIAFRKSENHREEHRAELEDARGETA